MKTLQQHVLTEHNGNNSELSRAIGVTPQHIKQCIGRGAVIDTAGQILIPMAEEYRVIDGKVYKCVKSKG